MEHLISFEFVAGSPQWGLLLLSAIAMAVLIKGADWLVDGASGLAYRLGIHHSRVCGPDLPLAASFFATPGPARRYDGASDSC